jgi:hypothetical protein
LVRNSKLHGPAIASLKQIVWPIEMEQV